ncbi:MAG: tetratricopeptide repeat protein [Leptolyngbyaceae cyanobacterium SM1_1_3]|nr:tetratricopeptide repeat protein [Leptolyngbyaceae cyanobacterium SM1_1_3]
MSNKRTLTLVFQTLCLSAAVISSLSASPVLAQSQAEQAGYRLLERGWIDDAIGQFQQALRQQPQSVRAQLGLAVAYERAGRDGEAWQAYQRVLGLEANNRQALLAVGKLGSYRMEWQAAGIEALTTLLQTSPADNGIRAQRALLLGYQGRFAESIADYEQVLSANPSPETVLGAAQIYTYSGSYSQGLALFERYLASGQPLSEAGAIAYSQTLQQTGQTTAAIELLNRRLQAAPNSIELRAALAVAYERNQQSEVALRILSPLRTQPDARLPLARALSQIGRSSGSSDLYREAIALYQQVLAATTAPSSGFITEVADVLSEDSTAQAAALQLYERLLADSPDQPAVQTKRLILAFELGQLSDRGLQQQLLALLQPLPAGAALQQQIGQGLIRLDSPDPSLLPVYQALIDANTPVDFLYFRLAQIELAQNNWSAAKAAIATYQSSRAGQQDIAPALLLAELERRQGNLEASALQYEAILRQSQPAPIVETALLGLSGIRQSQQRWAEALAAYEELQQRSPQSQRGRLGYAI